MSIRRLYPYLLPMKPLYLTFLFLLTFSSLVLSQQVQLYVEGVEKPSKPALKSTVSHAITDSLAARQALIPDTSILSRMLPNIQKVFSEKQWRHFADSLSKLPFGSRNPLLAKLPKEVSKQELLAAIQQEFFSDVPDSLAGKSPSDAATRLPGLPLRGDLSSAKGLPNMDLAQVKLPVSSLEKLAPLAGLPISSQHLPQLERLQKINLKASRFTSGDKQSFAHSELEKLRQKPRFKQRSYLEGVLGLSPGDQAIVQLSPTLGYHLSEHLSVGLGPNFLLRREGSQTHTTLGIKPFIKGEFLHRRAYLQTEGIFDSYGRIPTDGQRLFPRQSLVVLAGYLIPLSKAISFNLAFGYQVLNTRSVGSPQAPWVLRAGISTLKPTN